MEHNNATQLRFLKYFARRRSLFYILHGKATHKTKNNANKHIGMNQKVTESRQKIENDLLLDLMVLVNVLLLVGSLFFIVLLLSFSFYVLHV